MELKHNFGVGLWAAMVFAAILISNVCANGNGANVNLSIDNYLINPGDNVSVYLNVSTTIPISGGMVNVTYNDSLLTYNNYIFMNSFSSFLGGSVINPPNDFYNLNGMKGNFSIINISFTSNSNTCGVKVPIGIVVKDIVDNETSQNIPLNNISVQNGSVTIKCSNNCCPSGTTCNSTSNLCQATTIICYRDADGDGYTNATDSISTTNTNCSGQFNVSNGNDCNDNNNTIHPGAIEIYNGVDDNCSGVVDEGFCSTSANCT